MNHTTKASLIIAVAVFTISFLNQPCFAKRNIIPVTGKVNSFGTYSYIGKLEFDITNPGEQEIGTLTVEGTYNGEYPWIMRIYTDNTNYTGIAGARKQSPAGLVSTDGRFVVPLLVNAPNIGISQYKAVPDINQTDYKPYKSNTQETIADYTDCIIMGIDPRNEIWVAGEDGNLFNKDDNLLGDMTTATPFDIKFKGDFNERTVASNYTANLYIEIVSCP